MRSAARTFPVARTTPWATAVAASHGSSGSARTPRDVRCAHSCTRARAVRSPSGALESSHVDDLPSLVRSLVAIDSVNPALVVGAAGEGPIARWVEAWCRERAIETTWLEGTAGRPSVVARVRGVGGGRSLMLNAHLDTVGPASMAAPFEPRLEDGRVSGRGSLDMKSSVAACLLVLDRLRDAGMAGDLLFAAVADEEHASVGTREVLERFSADAAIVTEPTGLDVCVAHRGFAVYEVTVRGLASHTSRPDLGANAIAATGRVLHAIAAFDDELRRRPPHPRLGHAHLQPVLVAGGHELFTTPDVCRAHVEWRTLPGEDGGSRLARIEAIVVAALGDDPRLSASVEVVVEREPFEVADDAPIVRAVADAVRARRGTAPALTGAPFWMDAAFYAAAGMPTAVIGPGGGGMHAADEWVDLESVAALVDVLEDVARGWCG
jgi:acetylornithine deacetylase